MGPLTSKEPSCAPLLDLGAEAKLSAHGGAEWGFECIS